MLKLEVFGVLIILHLASSAPIDTSTLFDEENFDSENYDIVIDQRQNGTQNFRIKISGLNIAIPDDREQQQQQPSSILELEQFASLLSPTTAGGSNTPHRPNDSLNDLAELAAFFEWRKSSNKKKSSDTQSRTKDIPTDAQLADDLKTRTKDYVKEEHRRYKLLVGEKYLIPILQFLKKQTEDVKE